MSVVNEYLDKHASSSQRTVLERFRKLVKQLVPEAEEVISYGIPTFKYKGTYLIYFASYKNHMSVYPGPRGDKALEKKLEKFKVSKGTLRFTEDNLISDTLIKELVLNRLAEVSKG